MVHQNTQGLRSSLVTSSTKCHSVWPKSEQKSVCAEKGFHTGTRARSMGPENTAHRVYNIDFRIRKAEGQTT